MEETHDGCSWRWEAHANRPSICLHAWRWSRRTPCNPAARQPLCSATGSPWRTARVSPRRTGRASKGRRPTHGGAEIAWLRRGDPSAAPPRGVESSCPSPWRGATGAAPLARLQRERGRGGHRTGGRPYQSCEVCGPRGGGVASSTGGAADPGKESRPAGMPFMEPPNWLPATRQRGLLCLFTSVESMAFLVRPRVVSKSASRCSPLLLLRRLSLCLTASISEA